MRTVKCRWKHCQHESQDVPKNEAVQDGRNYYHKDCYKQKCLVQKIKDTWASKIDPNYDNMQLTVAINNLAFKRGYDLEYLLFVVNRGAEEKWLKYPNGLYQAVKGHDDLLKQWQKAKANKAVGNVQDKLDSVEPPEKEIAPVDSEKKLSGKFRKRVEWERMFAS